MDIRVLPQGYFHVHLFHYIGDTMLTSDSLTELEARAGSLGEALAGWGWAISKDKVQGPGHSVKFLGVV